jgi:2-polyprenyl-6-methoxyphenol hydroxylase-like FAD-dependent oxidoreductase
VGEQRAEVIVVGAGPTGLLIAGDLAEMGHRVEVLEKRSRQELNLTRAFSVHARAMDQLAIRGLAPALIDAGVPVRSMPLMGNLEVPFHKLPTNFPFMLVLPQYVLERELQLRAVASGAGFSYGVAVAEVKQSDDCVSVSGHDAAGQKFVREADFVVGADGMRSMVRDALGVGFPGDSILTSVIIGDVKLDNPPPTPLAVEASRWGFGFLCPFGDGYYRVLAWNSKTSQHVSDNIDFAALKDLFGKIFGRDLGMHSPRWISRFHSDERLADAYRVGRVFLAGDAAHVHSPAGGLGMNIGIQDAANLSWKLSYALRAGDAGALLDSYEREMRPVGARAIKDSGNLVRAAKRQSTMPALFRWGTVAIASHSGALGAAFALRMATSIAGISTSYSGSSKGSLAGKFWNGSSVIPEVNCHLQNGKFVLVSPETIENFGALADGRRVVNVKSRASENGLLLVRPDGYVAWHADSAAGEDQLMAMVRQCVPV